MTQDERWQRQYNELMDFMMRNERRPSKYKPEERGMQNWLRRQIKMYAKGSIRPNRLEHLTRLLQTAERCQRVNQYM